MNKFIYMIFFFVGILQTFVFAETFASSKAMLQTDRHCYISGDLMLVKVVVPFHGNQSAVYVDLASSDHKFIKGEILPLNNGAASGYIIVPDTLKTGNYKVRTYTQKSKSNLNNKLLCETKVFITNRFGNNDELYKNDERIIDSIAVKHAEVKVGSANVFFDKNIYEKRSKVCVKGNFHKQLSEGFNGVLVVRPVSSCEEQSSDRNGFWWRNGAIEKSKTVFDADTDESKGILVSGTVRNKITGNELSNLAIVLSFQDSVIRLKYSITDSLGKFSFLINNCFQSQHIYLTAFKYPFMTLCPDVEFQMDNKFIQSNGNKNDVKELVGYQRSNDSINLLKSVVNKAYDIDIKVDKKNVYNEAVLYEQAFLAGEISKITIIDDYIELPDFSEIAKEILPFTRIKERDNNYSVELFDGENNIVRKNPLVLVDGVPLTDIENILPWGSDKIKKVEVRVEPRYFGDLPLENGMVFIWTKKQDFWKSVECADVHEFVIPSYQQLVIFNFPDYSVKKQSIIPDFRQVVYWNPNISITNNKEFNDCFYTGDELGIFELCFAGMSGSGEPVYIRKYFEVK